jgi:hypothetical protein
VSNIAHISSSIYLFCHFFAGRNIPAVKADLIKIATAAKPPPQLVEYISAHPVIDALDFDAALRRVGDRVELIGQIVEVNPGVGRRGRTRGKQYVFINFGPWRGNIVKLSVWSEGLANLKEQPSADWVGRWVSVVGLMDPPYESTKYGYRHLSVTVERDGQIQRLNEAAARFRLASVGRITKPRNRDLVDRIVGKTGARNPVSGGTKAQSISGAKSRTVRGTGKSTSPNAAIVEKIKRAGQAQTGTQTSTTYSPPLTPPPPVFLVNRIQHRDGRSPPQKSPLERILSWLRPWF